MQERLLGLAEGLRAQGLLLTATRFSDSSDSSHGILHAKYWLSLSPSMAPTAVVLGNDAMALAFMRTVQQQGVVIPNQLSVMGFEGLPEAELYWPGLTTMAEPIRQMGIDACEFVLEKLRSSAPSESTGKDYAMRLVARESTGPMRAHPAKSEIPQRAAG